MPRPLPSVPAPTAWEPPARETLRWKIRVITPLFGGSYEPRQVDPENPVRAASVRGHLRFWWRATVADNFSTPQELFAVEEKIWGSTDEPGRVSLRCRVLQSGKRQACARFDRGKDGKLRGFPTFTKDWPAYALMPFQGRVKWGQLEEEPAEALLGVEFELEIHTPAELRSDVERAVSAWVHYGGLGARTRRGCGSLAADLPAPNLRNSNGEGNRQSLTLLAGSRFVLGLAHSDPIEAWNTAVNLYREFRQGPGYGRNEGTQWNRPGRSRWPEPDAIRRITGNSAPLHRPQHPVEDGFPRADLGLPIIFHFRAEDQRQGDPPDATLEGPAPGKRRFASPVITRAVARPDGKYYPLVLVLNAPHVWDEGALTIGVKDRFSAVPVTREQVDLNANARARVKPLQTYGGVPIREALLRHATKRWGRPVEDL